MNIMVPLQDPRDFFFPLWYGTICKVNIDVHKKIILKQTKVEKSCYNRVPIVQIKVTANTL